MSETSLRTFAAQNNVKRFAVPEPKFEEEDENKAYSFGRIGPKAEHFLDIVRADGFHQAIAYIDIRRIESSDPKCGFSITTAMQKYVFEGFNLTKCFNFLLQCRVAELREANRPTAMGAQADESIIAKLSVQNPY